MKTNENSELSRIHPTSSTERIFDCYLFINPLGKQCYKCEQEVMKFIKRTPHKVHVHFLPFHNFKSVTQYMKNNQLNVKKTKNLLILDPHIHFPLLPELLNILERNHIPSIL